MALLRFEPGIRFLLPSYLNIFACHEDRMDEFRHKFEEVETAEARAAR